MRTPRKVAHFDDPRLERQFEEIISFEMQAQQELVKAKKEAEIDEDEYEEDERSPSSPKGLVVSSAFKRHVLNWSRMEIDNIEGYLVSYSSSFDDKNTWNDWVNIDVGTQTFYIHDNLDPAFDYRYRIAAYNEEGYRSGWSNIYVAGKPGKVSLSEEVTGELIGDYLVDGSLPDDKFDEDVIERYVHEEKDSANLAVIGKTADELSSTVTEVYPDGIANASTIQQNSDEINLRVVALDEEGNPTEVNAQLNISQVDGNGYIYIGGDQITLDGQTNVTGNFEVTGENMYIDAYATFTDNVKIKGNLNAVTGNFLSLDANDDTIQMGGAGVYDNPKINLYDTEGNQSVEIESTLGDSGGITTFDHESGRALIQLFATNTDSGKYGRLSLNDHNGERISIQGNGRIYCYNEDRSNAISIVGDNGAIYCTTLEADTKDFKISHPNPELTDDYYLKHRSIESPTEGENIYRYKEYIKDSKKINLPNYFKHLNKNSQVFVTPDEHFGSGYGKIEGNELEINVKQEGEYNILIIGTRKDESAVNSWERAVVKKEE